LERKLEQQLQELEGEPSRKRKRNDNDGKLREPEKGQGGISKKRLAAYGLE